MFSRNRTTTVLAVATVVMASFVLTATSALAATIGDTTWTTTTDTTQDYITELSSGTWTWTINSGVIVTLGNNSNNSGRLFVGVAGTTSQSTSVNQTLILTSTDGGGTLNLFGNHSLDQVLGRLGHAHDTGTIMIDGGVSLIGGSNPLRYSFTADNAITINNGLVDFTGNGNTPFVRESNGGLTFNIADNVATLIVPGQIDDAADFAATWAGASVTASGSNPLSFDFDSIANKTTITAVPEPAPLAIAQSGSDLVFTWNSQPGKLYDLLGSTTLDTPPSTPWPVYDDGVTVTTDLDTNTVTIPRPADPRYFFSLREKDAPAPLPLETFEGGTLPAGWQAIDNAGTANTLWQVGDPSTGPSGGPPTGAGGSTHCAGTNIADSYADDADCSLITPAIDIPAGGATLTFQQWRDTEGNTDDSGTINVLDGSGTFLAELATGITGFDSDWDATPSHDLSAYAGQTIKLEFVFTSDNDAVVWAGWYLDDVTVTAN